jgi:hypothetical protein
MAPDDMPLPEICASSTRYNVIGNRASPESLVRPFIVEAHILDGVQT